MTNEIIIKSAEYSAPEDRLTLVLDGDQRVLAEIESGQNDKECPYKAGWNTLFSSRKFEVTVDNVSKEYPLTRYSSINATSAKEALGVVLDHINETLIMDGDDPILELQMPFARVDRQIQQKNGEWFPLLNVSLPNNLPLDIAEGLLTFIGQKYGFDGMLSRTPFDDLPHNITPSAQDLRTEFTTNEGYATQQEAEKEAAHLEKLLRSGLIGASAVQARQP